VKLATALILLATRVAAARPGGGHSFSGGGGGGGFGGGGGGFSGGGHYSGGSYSSGGSMDGTTLAILIALSLVILLVKALASSQATGDWNSGGVDEPILEPPDPPPRVNILGAVIATDPDFSLPVFEDLAYQLYAAAHRARADASRLALLAPYLSPLAGSQLSARPGVVTQAVIGALAVDGAESDGVTVKLGVRITSNLVMDRASSVLAVEHWSFVRAAGILTKPPERTRTWPCPHCGAPWAPKDGESRTCAHCSQAIVPGKLDWAVEQIWIESETDLGPTLTGTVAEQGTNSPSIKEANRLARFAALTADDPAVTWESVIGRIRMIYGRLNEGWNALELTPVRGLVTGAMLDYLRYWTTEYKRQGLRNLLEDATLGDIVLAKVLRDHYFDSITVRIYAQGHDYTLDASGDVVGGSRTADRPYSEYWTFLRSSTRRGPVVVTPTCPNCGAPLAISDTGECTHCGAGVENGSFDWLLSKIEQDDVYRG
jgi:uncharacterized Zn finger protein (UPF0148 family)